MRKESKLMTKLIHWSIGEVEDYFYWLGFKARGSPHIHLLVWVKDSPKFGSNLEDHVYKFIDWYIICQMPDPNADPMLHTSVSEFKGRNQFKSWKKGNVLCRFGVAWTKTSLPSHAQMMSMTMIASKVKVGTKPKPQGKSKGQRRDFVERD